MSIKSFDHSWTNVLFVFLFASCYYCWVHLDFKWNTKTLEIVKGSSTPTHSNPSQFYIWGVRTHRLPPAAVYVWLPNLYFATKRLCSSFSQNSVKLCALKKEEWLALNSALLVPELLEGLLVVQVTAQGVLGSRRKEALVPGLGRTLHGKGHTDKALPHLCALGYWFWIGSWIFFFFFNGCITVQCGKLRG